jgi:hypothetical protein
MDKKKGQLARAAFLYTGENDIMLCSLNSKAKRGDYQ